MIKYLLKNKRKNPSLNEDEISLGSVISLEGDIEDENAEKIDIKLNLKQYNFLINRINYLENENEEYSKENKTTKFLNDKQNNIIRTLRDTVYNLQRKCNEKDEVTLMLEDRIKKDNIEMGLMKRDYYALRKNYDLMKKEKNNGNLYLSLLGKDFPFEIKGCIKNTCIVCLDEKESLKFCNTDKCKSYFCLQCVLEIKNRDDYVMNKCPCCRGFNVMEN